MLINELPDDCLLAVFDQMNYLDDLINCYKVCVRWHYLIPERTKKVKYLIVQCGDYEVRGYSLDCVYYKEPDEVYGTCLSKLFPNLIIFEFCTLRCPDREVCECIVSFVRNHGTLKGLIDSYSDPMEEYCDTLEMLSTCSNSLKIPNGSRMKQLVTGGQDSLEAVQRYSHDFPNLEMLQMSIANNDHRDRLRVPLFEKLKILALYSDDLGDIFYGFQLIDSCPSLQSAHICMQTNRFFVDETLKHECLQDLVIEFCNGERINWDDLKRLLMKYPNLRHLRLQGLNMKHGQIKQLVHILSNLVLLDVRGCHKVTQKTADYVQNYRKRNGRSIQFYFDGNPDSIKADWPQLSNKEIAFSRGFDFMKHCFFASIFFLPRFLIPIDY